MTLVKKGRDVKNFKLHLFGHEVIWDIVYCRLRVMGAITRRFLRWNAFLSST